MGHASLAGTVVCQLKLKGPLRGEGLYEQASLAAQRVDEGRAA